MELNRPLKLDDQDLSDLDREMLKRGWKLFRSSLSKDEADRMEGCGYQGLKELRR